MHRWSDDITNELKLKLKHRLSNRLWAGLKQNPPKSERTVLLKRQQKKELQAVISDNNLTLRCFIWVCLLRRESWNCSEDYEFTHDQKPYKKNNLDTFPLPVQEKCYSILSSKRLKNKSGKQKKTEFIQKIKDIFGFLKKRKFNSKASQIKSHSEDGKHTIIVTQVKHDGVKRGGFGDVFHRLLISRTPQLWHAGSHWTCKVRFHVHSGFNSKAAGVWTQKRERTHQGALSETSPPAVVFSPSRRHKR